MNIKSFIPRYVPNKVVLAVLDIMSFFSFVSVKQRRKNAVINDKRLRHLLKDGGYIENQSEWSSVQFGQGRHHNMQYSGCEVIAAYNAMMALGEPALAKTMCRLMGAFEKNGAILRGDFGVSPLALARYFRQKGYQVSATTSRQKAVVNQLGQKSDVVILSIYNDSADITRQVHTVCITKDATNRFYIHNADVKDRQGQYCRKPVEDDGYLSLQEAVIKSSLYKPALLYLIGIRKPSFQ